MKFKDIKEGEKMRFSQRMGLKPIKVDIQKDGMNEELRIGLWNIFYKFIGGVKSPNDVLIYSDYRDLILAIWSDFLKYPLDKMRFYYSDNIAVIRDWFFNCEWYSVYDFLEFIIDQPSALDRAQFIKECNKVLERENSAYRFIGDKIAPIIDQNEISEIEEGLLNAQKNKFEGVYTHLKASLSMLTDRKKPDYRNSIKESISAVESLVKLISSDKKGDLNRAIRKLEEKIYIHPALKEAFIKLYGYTSDEGGIRHAMLESNNISFEDAKYMLVSCSAFINYLIAKLDKAGELLD